MNNNSYNNDNNNNNIKTFDSYLQKRIFIELFNDKLYSFKWRLSLNLVSKRWFDFMKSELFISKIKVRCDYPQIILKKNTVTSKSNNNKTDLLHLLNNQFCILRYCKFLNINVGGCSSSFSKYLTILDRVFSADFLIATATSTTTTTTTTTTTSTTDKQQQQFQYEICFQIGDTNKISSDSMFELCRFINRHNRSISIVGDFSFPLCQTFLENINVPFRSLSTFEMVESLADQPTREKIFIPGVESIGCFSMDKLNQDIPLDFANSLRSFKYYNIDSSIVRELQFLQQCSQLTKLFIYRETSICLESILQFINGCQTLRSVHLHLEITDSILSAILLNPNIKKLDVAKSTDDDWPVEIHDRLNAKYSQLSPAVDSITKYCCQYNTSTHKTWCFNAQTIVDSDPPTLIVVLRKSEHFRLDGIASKIKVNPINNNFFVKINHDSIQKENVEPKKETSFKKAISCNKFTVLFP
ncbi:hypothetical protein PPL_11881 [Heterostelium album PN500]|uniref:F-box domain-containing protein n=1 Tax=Heterostelium pallidum (strain ATCC 26659 / Pp 5 / PN500) TaxID=670386 RepID=D3BUR0_HETP5|nr:hypothetical protein PPL_11881 [Heterostelium album PN500]EFA74848.1 hypothetical protein PPL_11881 [Heterostelium album PN500]|eukprot:XP_020426982.1 hypothetical protein PPL_11881 [Heterostelium album PN500]